jgi:hypothetical protein
VRAPSIEQHLASRVADSQFRQQTPTEYLCGVTLGALFLTTIRGCLPLERFADVGTTLRQRGGISLQQFSLPGDFSLQARREG